MDLEKDSFAWAERLFGECDLGDERRVRRLVEVAGLAAIKPGASFPAMCGGNKAAQEAAYRFMRNDRFDTADIDEGAFRSVADAAQGLALVLAIQDTTAVSFSHATTKAFAESGSPTGFLAHTTLLVDPTRELPIGVADQERWMRKPKSERPGNKTRRERAYRNKESYRWEEASRRSHELLAMPGRVMDVGDREADIFEYLHYLQETQRRFTIRACNDRALLMTPHGRSLWATLEAQPLLDLRTICVEQRGGQKKSISQNGRAPRKKREAVLEVRTARVTLNVPSYRATHCTPITLHAVLLREVDPPAGVEGIEWLLLTSETVATLSEATQVIHYYECRWLIEEYFKAFKSGCRIEKRPLMGRDKLERMIAIIAHTAVRILQFHTLANQSNNNAPCDTVLSKDEYHCLWACTAPGKRLPKRTPPMRWAYEAIARMVGWTDTKGTGRIGWQTVWNGWDAFQQRMSGWIAATRAAAANAEM